MESIPLYLFWVPNTTILDDNGNGIKIFKINLGQNIDLHK
jgi:hypothetical protein